LFLSKPQSHSLWLQALEILNQISERDLAFDAKAAPHGDAKMASKQFIKSRATNQNDKLSFAKIFNLQIAKRFLKIRPINDIS